MSAGRVLPWELSDDKLMAECRFEAFIGPGPGGQKRNKTSSAVRMTHQPSGMVAIAAESRSQHENRTHALRRLRHKLAMEMRREIDVLTYHPPGWFGQYPHLRIAEKNPQYPSAVAEVLDVLEASRWNIGPAAALLGLTTRTLARFLHDDPPLWAKVNQLRADLGMKPLRAD